MDVPVQHGDRPEALQAVKRFAAVARAPTPLRIDRPERDMGEDDDGRARSQPAHVGLEPGDLVRTEAGQAACLEVHDIDEGDEVDALALEAVPAVALRSLTVAGLVGSPAIEPVMLAGNVVDLAVGALDDLFGGVELSRLGEVSDVAGMDQEGGFGRQLGDLP